MYFEKHLLVLWCSYLCWKAHQSDDEYKEGKAKSFLNNETYELLLVHSFCSLDLNHHSFINRFSHLEK